jgi:hypothetical protein
MLAWIPAIPIFHNKISPKSLPSKYIPIYLSVILTFGEVYIYGSTVLMLNFGRFFRSLILYTVGRAP